MKILDLTSQQAVFWVMELCQWPIDMCDDGWMMTMRALGTSRARILGAFEGKLIGASSYRLSEDGVWIKRINTGVLFKRRGIGTALVEAIREKHPERHHWCKSVIGAHLFCESLGMHSTRALGRHCRTWIYQDEKSEGLTPPC